MKIKYLQDVEYFSQRDNKFNPSIACFPTSAAMAMNYVHTIIHGNMQLEDYIVQECLNLSDDELAALVKKNGKWILDHKTFQVIPIMAYVCNKIASPVKESWAISFDNIKKNIDKNLPVVCLGNFKTMVDLDGKQVNVGGHYNTIIGYDTDTMSVFTLDPWGNAHTNYKDHNGVNVCYDWSVFCRSGSKSFGLIFG